MSDETVLQNAGLRGQLGPSFRVSVGAGGLGACWHPLTPCWGLWPGPGPLAGLGCSTSNTWSQGAVAGLCNCPASAFVTISLLLFLEENSQNVQLTMLNYTSQRQLAHLWL